MVNRIHRDAANVRTLSEVPLTAGGADDLVLVLEIPELTDRRATDNCNLSNFARRHAHLRVLAFFSHQLRGAAGGTHELAALSRTQLDVVYDRALRNVRKRQRVSDFDVRIWTRLDNVADFDSGRRQDVALFTVAIVQQSDVRRTIGIVLDRSDFCRDGILGSLEIDDAILPARSAATMTRRDVTVEVAARVLLANFGQRTL